MGAKASTANGEDAASRERSYSTDSMVGSASDIVAGSLLHSFQGLTTSERQRARSLSSVPSGHENSSVGTAEQAHGHYDMDILDTENGSDDPLDSPLGASIGLSLGLGRVYTARSLPSHIWSLNGIKCPVCSKFVLPDDVECHLVICLTKPRLTYNEDVLTCDKGECVICLEDLQQGDTIARLPCLCVYHKSCIDQWFDINRSCPEHPGD